MTPARTLRVLAKAIGKDAAKNCTGRSKKRRMTTARELKAIARSMKERTE